MPAHQRPLPLPSRRSPLSATRSITSVRVSSLECSITLSSSPPPPDFAHKPMPVAPVEGDPPVSNPSLCLHVLRSGEYVDIYDAGPSAGLGKRSRIVRGSPVRWPRMAGGGTQTAPWRSPSPTFALFLLFRLPPVYSGVSPVILYMCTADGAPPVRPSQPPHSGTNLQPTTRRSSEDAGQRQEHGEVEGECEGD